MANHHQGFLPLQLRQFVSIVLLGALFAVELTLEAFAVESRQQAPLPFFPNGTYDPNIPKPDEVIGFPLASEPVNYSLMTKYLFALDQAAARVKLTEYGKTYEGRSLYYLVISSEENAGRLQEIQSNISRLADPRKLASGPSASELIRNTPAVVWIGYSIHGDELSSTDAALQVAYQLAAGTDTATQKILDGLVVCIDPLQNPDGRERFVHQMQQWCGIVPNSDVQSMHHTGMWPWGRGNHYLFDMNRDFLPMVHAETRARMHAILQWNPQVLIDSHEMGALDTYLFSPPREPFNPNLTAHQHKWWKIFAADQAKAFDRYGWQYYTRDWNEMWYPGYQDSWVLFLSGVGILYEQAGVEGSSVKRMDASVMGYRETVHHHFTSSITNLATAARRHEELLQDYFRDRQQAARAHEKDPFKCFILDPSKHSARVRQMMEHLLELGIEMTEADEDFTLAGAQSYWDLQPVAKAFAKGAYIISTAQTRNPLIHAFLDFDPRLSTAFVESERKELEKHNRSRIYDVTGWSLPMAYGVDAYWCRQLPKAKVHPVSTLEPLSGRVENAAAKYAFVIDYDQDQAPLALAFLLDKGYNVYAAEKPFKLQGKSFARGSMVLFLANNPAGLTKDLSHVSETLQLQVRGVDTGLVDEGPDLGSGKFRLLQKPKVAILANSPVSPSGFGPLWYLLDNEMKMRYSVLDANRLSGADLAPYNVLIMPPVYQAPQNMQSLFGKPGMEKLRHWIESGGTLVAIGSAAAFAADSSSKLSQVRMRHQVLDKLDVYASYLALVSRAEAVKVDSLSLWSRQADKTDATLPPPKEKKDDSAPKMDKKEMAEWDTWLQRFSPQGAILQANLDEEHWLTFGMSSRVPIMLGTTHAYLAKEPVKIPARLADRNHLRLSGLLWPEARDRWANTAFATQERLGKGQVILFADEPYFRAYFHGSGKLLINAILLGPGFGAEATLPY